MLAPERNRSRQHERESEKMVEEGSGGKCEDDGLNNVIRKIMSKIVIAKAKEF